MLIVSAFTEGTPYERDARRLRASLDRFDIPSFIKPFHDSGDWHQNVMCKQAVCLEVSRCYSGPFVWVDADAFVHVDFTDNVLHEGDAYYENLPDISVGFDFMAHWFQGPSGGYDYSRNDNWFLAGTMYFSNSIACKRLIEAWHKRCLVGDVKGSGQEKLRQLVEDYAIKETFGLKVGKLPGRYTYIFDKSMHVTPDEPNWIEHTIASRENKDQSKGNVNEARQKRLLELDAILKKG